MRLITKSGYVVEYTYSGTPNKEVFNREIVLAYKEAKRKMSSVGAADVGKCDGNGLPIAIRV